MEKMTSGLSPAYLQLRDRILDLDPLELGLMESSVNHVWGVIMETGYEVGTASLAVLADGTTSLYYSTGGGLIGSPDYYPLAELAKGIVALAGKLADLFSYTEKIDLPSVGLVSFTLLTFSGKLSTAAPETSLAAGKHPLSTLYQSGREILRLLSMLKDKKRA